MAFFLFENKIKYHFYLFKMSVSFYEKMIKNGSSMKKRCDQSYYNTQMTSIIDEIELSMYKSSDSTTPPILIHSVPGCGKTHLVRAIVQKLQKEYDYLKIDNSQIMSEYYGHTQKSISYIFTAARNNEKPVILIFDEIDGLFSENSSQDVNALNISTFNQEIDGDKDNSNIILIATTNHFDKLSSSIKDRFTRKYKFDLPDENQRKNFFIEKFAKHQNTLNDEDFRTLAKKTRGKSFRDLEGVFDDILNIEAKLIKDAPYFVIGHGFDHDGNKQKGLYIPIPERAINSIKNDGTRKFAGRTAQITITSNFIQYYFNKNSTNRPTLERYYGQIMPRDCLTEIEDKAKKALYIGSFVVFIISFFINWIFLKFVLKRWMAQFPSLKIILPIVSFLFSIKLIWKINSKANDSMDSIFGGLRIIVNYLGYWFENVFPILNKVISFLEVILPYIIRTYTFIKRTLMAIKNKVTSFWHNTRLRLTA